MNGHPARLNVYIIECPDPNDLYYGRSEGRALCEVLHQAGIKAQMRTVTSAKHFSMALAEYEAICATFPEGLVCPTLHISAHGDPDGLAIGNDPTVGTWAWLYEQLVRVNQSLRGKLEICISACEGFKGMRMATIPAVDKPLPFNVMIGPNYKPTWGEALIGFSAFYLRLIVDKDVHSALRAIHAATGREEWYCLKAETAHEMFMNEVRKVDVRADATDSSADVTPSTASSKRTTP